MDEARITFCFFFPCMHAHVRRKNKPKHPPQKKERERNQSEATNRRTKTNLASLAEYAVPIAQPISGEPLHPRVHEGVRVHHEGVEVDQGAPVLAPFHPAVVTVSREVDDLGIPRFCVVRHGLRDKNKWKHNG